MGGGERKYCTWVLGRVMTAQWQKKSDLWVISKKNLWNYQKQEMKKCVTSKWEVVGYLVFSGSEYASCSTANVLSSIPFAGVPGKLRGITGRNLSVRKLILREEQDPNLTNLIAWTYHFLNSVELEIVLPGQK